MELESYVRALPKAELHPPVVGADGAARQDADTQKKSERVGMG